MQYATSEFISIKFMLVIYVCTILFSTGCSNSDSNADYEKALDEPIVQKEPVKQEAPQEKLSTENLPVIEDNIAEKSKSTESETIDIAIEITPDKQEYAVGDKPLLK